MSCWELCWSHIWIRISTLKSEGIRCLEVHVDCWPMSAKSAWTAWQPLLWNYEKPKLSALKKISSFSVSFPKFVGILSYDVNFYLFLWQSVNKTLIWSFSGVPEKACSRAAAPSRAFAQTLSRWYMAASCHFPDLTAASVFLLVHSCQRREGILI